jgi:hypothetical protein
VASDLGGWKRRDDSVLFLKTFVDKISSSFQSQLLREQARKRGRFPAKISTTLHQEHNVQNFGDFKTTSFLALFFLLSYCQLLPNLWQKQQQ